MDAATKGGWKSSSSVLQFQKASLVSTASSTLRFISVSASERDIPLERKPGMVACNVTWYSSSQNQCNNKTLFLSKTLETEDALNKYIMHKQTKLKQIIHIVFCIFSM